MIKKPIRTLFFTSAQRKKKNPNDLVETQLQLVYYYDSRWSYVAKFDLVLSELKDLVCINRFKLAALKLLITKF